jgi:hypothetical protein
MLRKTIVVPALIVGAVGVCLTLAGMARTADRPAVAPLVHTVIFTLTKDAPESEADALIADCHEMLRPIPSVRDLRAGKPADNPMPGNAQRNYSVGLLVLFDDVQGLNAYAKDPMHLKFVQKHGKYLDRQNLRVFDFVDQKK